MDKFYKIEKNVKMPIRGHWAELMQGMEVGDSILFPTHDEARNFSAAFFRYNMKAKERKTPDGHRVWRTE